MFRHHLALRRRRIHAEVRRDALGAVLLVLLAVEGGTIPFLGQLEVVHVVVGPWRAIVYPLLPAWGHG
jgi:hypothetical protein